MTFPGFRSPEHLFTSLILHSKAEARQLRGRQDPDLPGCPLDAMPMGWWPRLGPASGECLARPWMGGSESPGQAPCPQRRGLPQLQEGAILERGRQTTLTSAWGAHGTVLPENGKPPVWEIKHIFLEHLSLKEPSQIKINPFHLRGPPPRLRLGQRSPPSQIQWPTALRQLPPAAPSPAPV